MADEIPNPPTSPDILRMAVDVVSAYFRGNAVPADQLAEVLDTVYRALDALQAQTTRPNTERPIPVVSVRRSIQPDHIVCLEDGRKLKMLKRHLRTTYDMSPEEYRAKWGLPADYPMVAPEYSARRSAFAKKIGFGRKKIGFGRKKR